jgi:hypothetical protein
MDFIFGLALSAHLGLEGSFNGLHPHVRFYEDGAIAGAYYNSVDRISFYGGYRLEPTDRLGVEFSLVTGYPAYGELAPMVRGTYDINDNVRMFAAPALEIYDENNIGAVLGIEFLID